MEPTGSTEYIGTLGVRLEDGAEGVQGADVVDKVEGADGGRYVYGFSFRRDASASVRSAGGRGVASLYHAS